MDSNFPFGPVEPSARTICEIFSDPSFRTLTLLLLVEVEEVIPGYFPDGAGGFTVGSLVVSSLLEVLSERPQLDEAKNRFDVVLAAEHVLFRFPFVDFETPWGRCSFNPAHIPIVEPGNRLLIASGLARDFGTLAYLPQPDFWWFRDGLIQPLPYRYCADNEPIPLESLKSCIKENRP